MKPPPTADRVVAALWALFGLAIVVASWRMDRLEHQGINPWSAPALLPGALGLLFIVLAIALALRPPLADVDQQSDPPRSDAPNEATEMTAATATATNGSTVRTRTLTAAALCIGFAVGGIGHGLPFQLVAAAFVLAFIAVFSWSRWRAEARLARGLGTAFIIAVGAALAIGWLFESVFLVRLP